MIGKRRQQMLWPTCQGLPAASCANASAGFFPGPNAAAMLAPAGPPCASKTHMLRVIPATANHSLSGLLGANVRIPRAWLKPEKKTQRHKSKSTPLPQG